jgi:hypothetical protein
MNTKLTYETLGVRNTQEVIDLCETWWYDAKFYENTQMEFKSEPVYWWNMFQLGEVLAVGGRNEDGELKSCYVATVSPYMFNHKVRNASEIVWCIDEQYRSGRNLIQLLNEIEKLLADNNVSQYNLNLPQLEDNERLVTKLQKRGFFIQDVSLIKEISYE